MSNFNKLLERITAQGHINLLGLHRSTLEFTKELNLTKNGDCIIGVGSNTGCMGLSNDTKFQLRKDKKFLVKIIAGDFKDEFYGYGDPNLILTDIHELVFRKSDFICPRTIMIRCTKAAKDINRDLIHYLSNPENIVTLEIYSTKEDENNEIFSDFIITNQINTQKIMELLSKNIKNSSGFKLNSLIKLIKLDNSDDILIPIMRNRDNSDNSNKSGKLSDDNKSNRLNEIDRKNLGEFLKENGIDEFEIISLGVDNEDLRESPRMGLREMLLERFPEELINNIPCSFDIIGNIAITEIDRWDDLSVELLKFNETKDISVLEFKKIVGDLIISGFKSIKTVLNKIGAIDGEFRVREFEWIGGINETETIHSENNSRYKLDITKVFFSPRLVFERERISNEKFERNCIVLDCFAGVGPFSIQIAKKHEVTILSIEKNPDACRYLIENIKLNKKKMLGQIIPFCGDFRDFKESEYGKIHKNNVSHIIMNLPEKNLEFIDELPQFIKKEGTILTIYLFAPEPDPIKTAYEELETNLKKSNLAIEERFTTRTVKNFSPTVQMVVIDVKIRII